MSGYRAEWPCCGDETYTNAWEPEECPFCQVGKLNSEVDKLRARIGQLQDALVWSLGKLSIEIPVTAENQSYRNAFEKAEKVLATDGDAWLFRKEADAVEKEILSLARDLRLGKYTGINVKELIHEAASRANRLREKADNSN